MAQTRQILLKKTDRGSNQMALGKGGEPREVQKGEWKRGES